MNLQLITKDVHGDATNAMKEILETKLSFLEKITDEPSKVTVSREGKGFDVIIQTSVAGKPLRMNSGVYQDAYRAIDILVQKVKKNVNDKRNAAKPAHKEIALGRVEDAHLNDAENTERMQIVERKKIATKPMSEAGAIVEMELLGYSSFIFINNEADDRVCMLYARHKDGYGIIELE